MYIDNTKHYDIASPNAANEYASLLPLSGHLVHIDNKTYTVAMFHQLACLDTIRRSYLSGTVDRQVEYCMNYLRQSISCQADLRIESVRRDVSPHIVGFPGYYTCRDWEAVYRAADSQMMTS